MTVALTHLRGHSIGVFGLARSGLATVAAAKAGDAARIFVWDDREDARQKAESMGATALRFEDWPWAELDSLVLSPGVPLTHPKPHPIVDRAKAAQVEIICDVELLWRQAEGTAKFVAITGTNGKSTTTALIGHVLADAGRLVSVGGNIGRSALDLDPPEPGRIYVIEMSSYQLDLIDRFRPDVAVWLNLTPDHLDRHGDMEGYRRAKMHIFDNMAGDDLAVIGVDEPVMDEVAAELASRDGPRVETVSVLEHPDAALFVDSAGTLIENGAPIASFGSLPTLRGAHNHQNAAVAFAATRAFGLDPATIIAAMARFPGLAHRMEIVSRRGKVLFVNDSKATNADAAAKALATFEPIYWIAGGLAKEGGIESLDGFFPRIAKAYLIGKAADDFAATLGARVPHLIAGDLVTAVERASADAARDTAPEPAVLLSPACASFDQFTDFEARGEAFRRAVRDLDLQKREAFA